MKKLAQVAVGLAMLQAAVALADDKFESFKVETVKGSAAKVKADAGAEFKPAVAGETHKAGAIGKTGDDSNIVVAFDQQNKFRLLPNTEVSITTSTRDHKYRKVVDLTLQKGKVDVDLADFPKNYQLKVQTPTAVCGAVGTHFVVASSGATASEFVCKQGTIFAESLEDGSFKASGIDEGETLKAKTAPGKENSYTKLDTSGGDMAIAMGSEGNEKKVKAGTSMELAQEHQDSTKIVALHVNEGSVGDLKAGNYVMDGEDVLDYGKKDDGPAKVKAYIAAAQKEGSIKADLNRATDETKKEQLEKELQKAADDATEKRKEMLEFRAILREAIRSAVGTTMRGSGGGGTRVP